MADRAQRVLVTGATGMLGKDVSWQLSRLPGWEVANLVRKKVPFLPGDQVVADLEDSGAVAAALKAVCPDCIIHCAALTDLERCERDHAAAYDLNVVAVRRLTDAMPDHCRLLYVSTDSVFDGGGAPYDEDASPNPLNYYAQSKLQGERAALETGASVLVLRANIYGFHLPALGKSLVEWACGSFSRGVRVKGFDDVYFNPLYTGQLAELMVGFVSRPELSGILNVGAAEGLSKFEFLQRLATALGYDSDLVERSDSHAITQLIARPVNTVLDCTRLRHLSGSVPSLSEGLSRLSRDYYHHYARS